MRRFLTVGVLLGVVVVAFAACSDSGSDEETAGLQLKADTYEIGRIEEQFHQAMTLKDIDQMMSLWAPNATLTVGPDLTAAGVDEIREFWLTKSLAFAPETTWVSDHPAYKLAFQAAGWSVSWERPLVVDAIPSAVVASGVMALAFPLLRALAQRLAGPDDVAEI